MNTRPFALSVLLLAGALAACGNDDATTAASGNHDGGADPTDTSAAANGSTDVEADGFDQRATADGTPSPWYSQLDALDLPAPGDAYLVLDGVTSDFTVSYCEHSVNNVLVDELPAENGDDVFKLSVQLGGTLDDGRSVSLFAYRLVNPEKMGMDPYEIDSVQFNANDGQSTSVASRAEASRPEAGGPVRDDGTLPLLKIDGASVTAVGVAVPMASAEGQEDMAVVGPFELAATCD